MRECVYRVRVEQWDSLMFQMFQKGGSSGRGHTLEVLLILGFHGDWVSLKGGGRPAAGIQHLQGGGRRGGGGVLTCHSRTNRSVKL